jgi:hypothetical protein
MKATLEFDYPEDERDHKYALAGLDALLLINDLENEIREMLRRDGGHFKKWIDENDKQQSGCYATLERVWQYIIDQKEERRLPYID